MGARCQRFWRAAAASDLDARGTLGSDFRHQQVDRRFVPERILLCGIWPHRMQGYRRRFAALSTGLSTPTCDAQSGTPFERSLWLHHVQVDQFKAAEPPGPNYLTLISWMTRDGSRGRKK